ncbi:MAG TPA: aminodeoxychorismate lyase [Gammaproteobacteria bacterium]|jgi:4-amino-4-deoxychorismate lyase
MNPVCWIDGQPAEALPLTDRGLHYGDGLFETLAVREGRIRRIDMHLERLQEGCERLGLPKLDQLQLHRELDTACGGKSEAVLKLMLTRGSGGRGYRPPAQQTITRILFRYPWPHYPSDWSEQGIELRICRIRLGLNPALAGLKHLNRLEQVMARAEWSEGAQEGLMLGAEGGVIEGTMTNLFASPAEGQLVTPDLGQAGVAGVTRRHILECARRKGLAVEVRSLSLDELLESREIFVCNSIAGVWPVRRIEARSYVVGALTRRAAAWATEP